MCFNTFIQHIKAEKYQQFGFSLRQLGLFLNPIHWFQFADDAAVVSGQENENQHLLNRFSLWCQWADMIIRVDKCSTFGMKKNSSKSVQFLPKLFINNDMVPCVKLSDSFCYLGRHFDFEMSNTKHKSELVTTFEKLVSEIDQKPLHPKNKLLLYNQYVLSKVSWHFYVVDIPKTWVQENLDSLVLGYIRKWLDVPVCGTLSNIFLPCNKYGQNILPPSIKFTQCQSVTRKTLKNSPNDSIKQLWKTTSTHTNLQYDVYKSTKEVTKDFHAIHEEKLQNQLLYQGSFFSSIVKLSLPKLNSIWSTVQSKLPKNIFNFTIRYINNTLPTRKNLAKWGLSPSSDCSLCLQPESLLHVVAGCNSYLEQGRFTWRHDSVLLHLAKTFKSIADVSLYADLSNFKSPSSITGDEYRPDLLLATKQDECLYVLELTVGYESNLQKNISRKKAKYKESVLELKSRYKNVVFVNLSISALGVFANDSANFENMLIDIDFNNKERLYIIRKLMNITIRSTYYIFCCRNREWNNPELLHY